jgi:hypothetical protein
VAHDHAACGNLWNSQDAGHMEEAARWADDQRAALKQVHGEPQADTAEPCDENCELACVHHVPGVGWDLSFGSRINVHPVDTTDDRMIVQLNLSDDAVMNRGVTREATREQVATFATHLLALVPDQAEHAAVELLTAYTYWLASYGQLVPAPPGVADDQEDMVLHFLHERREARHNGR